MADPLSVLGAAIGVTSLILQMTDECVKGFKLYKEATGMPKNCQYLLVRLQIEQQRFLNFGREAGILYTDGGICAALQVNRSLLLAVLAEIRALFETYATANGKYGKILPQAVVNWTDHTDPEDLMDLLCLPPESRSQDTKNHSEKQRSSLLKHARGLGDKVVQTGRDLRSIVVEPRRLIWAAVDQESFGHMISDLEHLISFLITLLDSSQARRLQEEMTATYLQVLQIRNDMEDLANLVKALRPAADNPESLEARLDTADSSLLAQAIVHETKAQESKKVYLRQLAEVKLEHTKMTQLAGSSSMTPGSRDLIGTLLDIDDLGFSSKDLALGLTNTRVQATYQDRNVLVEWKHLPYTGSPLASNEHAEYRIGLLTGLLRHEKPIGFRALPCLGYVKKPDGDDGFRFGIVFDKPLGEGADSKPLTLRNLYEQITKPSLSTRISMCAVLARCVHSFHAVNWLHKGLQSSNIIFFASEANGQGLDQPFVSGFEMSRPSNANEMTEKPTFDPFADIYRHPLAQSSQMDGNYRDSYDIYSLGIVLIEIAFWARIENIVSIEDLAKSKPSALIGVQSRLLGRSHSKSEALQSIVQDEGSYLQHVAPECGDAFRDIVECCLTANDVERPRGSGKSQPSISLRLQRLIAQDVVQRLEDLASTL